MASLRRPTAYLCPLLRGNAARYEALDTAHWPNDTEGGVLGGCKFADTITDHACQGVADCRSVFQSWRLLPRVQCLQGGQQGQDGLGHVGHWRQRLPATPGRPFVLGRRSLSCMRLPRHHPLL